MGNLSPQLSSAGGGVEYSEASWAEQVCLAALRQPVSLCVTVS